MFLIVVLFFVYPLKFLTKLALFAISVPFKIDWLTQDLIASVKGADMGALMIIYGLGVSLVFFILSLMYRYAWRNREALSLNEIEQFDTQTSRTGNLLMAVIPLLSVLLAILFYNQQFVGAIAGFSYFLYWPTMMVFGIQADNKRKKIVEAFNQKENENELAQV